MPLHPNNLRLISVLEAMPLLDGRYEGMKFVNYNSVIDEKRGCFSLVFRAFDRLNQKTVALKFYDIDPQRMMDIYRQQSFQREHEILKTLLTKKRCLQLASGLSTYDLQVPLPDGTTVALPCQYFAVEWLDKDIDDYFYCLGHGSSDSIQKLRIFYEIVLAIEALHRLEVYHRDIKADNLREYQNAVERFVVAIDLGTAARFTSANLSSNYTHSVGAPYYAAPEARCGLAGHRSLAPLTDIYALGCLLFELFNLDYFYRELTRCNHQYEMILMAMTSFLHGARNEDQQLSMWKEAVARLGPSITRVSIDSAGNTVPQAIVDLLDEVVSGLTQVSHSKRPSLAWVRTRIGSAIRVLENDRIYKQRLAAAKLRRARREEKAKRAEARLTSYLKENRSC